MTNVQIKLLTNVHERLEEIIAKTKEWDLPPMRRLYLISELAFISAMLSTAVKEQTT
jgi:hypothetical protein